jgi:hypothetical protein
MTPRALFSYRRNISDPEGTIMMSSTDLFLRTEPNIWTDYRVGIRIACDKDPIRKLHCVNS